MKSISLLAALLISSVLAVPALADEYNPKIPYSDEYLYGSHSGRCTAAEIDQQLLEQQGRTPSKRTLATLRKCEYYGKLAAKKRSPARMMGLFSQ